MEHQKPEPELKAVHVHGDLQRKHAEHAARANAKRSTHSSRPRTRGEPLEPFEIGTWHRIQPMTRRMRFIVRGEAQTIHSSQHAEHAHEHARDMHTYSRSHLLLPRATFHLVRPSHRPNRRRQCTTPRHGPEPRRQCTTGRGAQPSRAAESSRRVEPYRAEPSQAKPSLAVEPPLSRR